MDVTYNTDYGTLKCLKTDFYISQSLACGKVYEQETIEAFILPNLDIRKPRTILDIGAHVGSHTLVYAKKYPDARVLSFEPQSPMYDMLVQNMQDNFLYNVTAHHVAVGHILGSVSMHWCIEDGPNNNEIVEYATTDYYNYGGMSLGVGGEVIDMITVDSLQLDTCDFMKIDVEGAEPLVLHGAKETIERCTPILFFEWNHKTITDDMASLFHEDTIQGWSTWEMLDELGYQNISGPFPCGNYLAMRSKDIS